MDRIESKNNSQIKEARKLKSRKYRDKSGMFFIEGFRFVKEAVKSEFEVPYIFIRDDFKNKWEDFSLKSMGNYYGKVYSMPKEVFNLISDTYNSQGIAAVVCSRNLKPEEKGGFYVLADRIQDPGNMGTIIRSADASGANGVIVTKGTVDIYNEKTLRATMGSIFHIPVINDIDFKYTSKLKDKGYKILSGALNSDLNFYQVDLKKNIILAVGNEANGISPKIEEMADIVVKIPMPGKAESLNVSAAASIMMFEIVRQNMDIH